MKEFLEKTLNVKFVTGVASCYWTFWLKGHLCYLGLVYAQPFYSRSGNDYYCLRVDSKMAVRKGRFEDCINKLKEL